MHDGVADLSSPAIMGVVDLRSCPNLLDTAAEMQELGATFLELGLSCSNGYPEVSEELNIIIPQLEKLRPVSALYLAVNTTHPETMKAAAAAGADLIVDPNALREPGAVDTIAQVKLPVCLVFDQNTHFEEDTDPTGTVSEFLYERIDACLNARIPRSAIIIDPSIGMDAPIEFRLKMMGRLNTFKSFALPISIPAPRILPKADPFMCEHMPAVTAVAIFAIDAGVSIIRTHQVGELALALDTWQACSKSARPFRLSKLIVKRFFFFFKDEGMVDAF